MANEKRLIDANELKYFVCETCNAVNSDEPCEPSDCRCMQIIDEMPTVDAVEVVHGRWIIGTGENALMRGYRMCSVCGEIIKTQYSFYGMFNYCPNCGAKMDNCKDDLKWKYTPKADEINFDYEAEDGR